MANIPTAETQRPFSRSGQFRSLLLSLGWRWLLTAVLCAITIVVLWRYEKTSENTPLTNTPRHVFNALFTGLVLGIGLHVASSLNHIAGSLKWRLLAARRWTPKQFNSLMACEEQTQVVKLMFISRGSRVSFYCAAWILFNIVVQTILAALGLTVQVALPIDFNSLRQNPILGDGFVADMNPIFTLPFNSTSQYDLLEQKISANNFGLGATVDPVIANNASKLSVVDDLVFFNENGQVFWRHVFSSRNVKGKTQFIGAGGIPTTQFVDTQASCDEISITTSNVFYKNPSGETIVEFGSPKQTITFPINAINKTAYMTVDPKKGRTVTVYVFSSWIKSGADSVRLFKCQSEVKEMATFPKSSGFPAKYYDAPRPTWGLRLPDLQARIFAGSIGWIDAVTTVYLHGSHWDFDQHATKEQVGQKISQFAVGSINTYDRLGPKKLVQDVFVPSAAQVIEVKWIFAGLILGGIPVAQFILSLFAIFLLISTVVRDNSPFATAVLLKEAVNELEHGKRLSGDEIAKLIDHDMIYSWTFEEEEEKDTEGLRLLTVFAEDNSSSRKQFPRGDYD